MNRGHKQTDLIIMNFAKAFDNVQQRRLLHKLDYYGIRGSTHKWISSWLFGRSQQVVFRWSNLRSSPCFIRCTPRVGLRTNSLFMPPKELWEAYSNRIVRPSVPLSVRCISPIFIGVGIPNFVCGYILGWQSVVYYFRVAVTLTLTSDLVL